MRHHEGLTSVIGLKRAICNARVLYADEENVVYASASQGYVYAHTVSCESLFNTDHE